MDFEAIFNSEIFRWGILPLMIFLARVLDVSMGTIRIVFVSRGLKVLAPIIGFFEVTIWLLAIRVIMQNLDNVVCYLAYGAGFAMGTFIGMKIEGKLALGSCVVRLITKKDATELIDFLRLNDYGVTSLTAQGSTGDVNVVFVLIKRRCLNDVVEIINIFNPRAFFTVEDVKTVREGVFPAGKNNAFSHPTIGPFMFWRKGK